MSPLRLSLRRLLEHPGSTAVTILTLAVGIGANTGIFSVVEGVLLKPLPYREADRLVALWERDLERGVERDRVSGPDYLDWRERNTVFADMGLVPAWEGSGELNLVLPDGTVEVEGTYASASLFTTLGTPPLLGRAPLPEEDRSDGARVAVLGHGLWQRSFGGDPAVLGRTLTIDTFGRRDYTIVGVMPPGFGLPRRHEVWLSLGGMDVVLEERRSAHWYDVVARLAPGASLEQARTEMNAIQGQLRQAHRDAVIGEEVVVVPLLEQAVERRLRASLLVLWGVVACVLLIACANVASLSLARAETRRREMALRLALGASRGQVVLQLLAESIVLAVLGGGLGLLVGAAGLKLLVALDPGDIPRLQTVTLDGVVLAFTVVVSVVTGILCGLAPAWQLSHPCLGEALRHGAHGSTGSVTATRTRSALIVGELALSLALLTGAGTMLLAFARMLEAERGFEPEHLVVAELDFSVAGFSTWVRATPTRPQVALEELMQRLRSHPGVQAVGVGSELLRIDNQPPRQPFAIHGRPPRDPREQPTAHFKGVSPDWLRALGGRLVRGRGFTAVDTLEAPGVALVNETFARRFFPGEDPIGARLALGDGRAPLDATDVHGVPVWAEIVGVVSDVKSLHPRPEAAPEAFRPHWQWPMQGPTLLVRVAGREEPLAEAIRREVAAAIPNLPPPRVRTMEGVISASVAQPRLHAGLLVLFAALATGLAAVGLYAVLACTVADRRREIGVRVALGARPRDVTALVVRQGMKLTLYGAAIGTAGALAFVEVIERLAYGTRPGDGLVVVAVAALLGAVALLACWLPARRAAMTDPVTALRAD